MIAVLLVCAAALVPSIPPAADAAPRAAYDWPLSPRPQVVRGFDLPDKRWQPGHRGVDLGASPEIEVLAAGAGTVNFAGSVAGRPTVSIRHGDGLLTTYEPVTSRVRRGDQVGRGDVIGVLLAGHDGCAVGACLHWGARRGSGHDAVYLDPLGLLGVLRVRLKPLKRGDAPGRALLGAVRR